ncbi:hypothetical protein FGB62_285g07 [Gracilaria domingensis]|nr:hypothetical protein FGB62_285g07 [Gracilaria domingensis]
MVSRQLRDAFVIPTRIDPSLPDLSKANPEGFKQAFEICSYVNEAEWLVASTVNVSFVRDEAPEFSLVSELHAELLHEAKCIKSSERALLRVLPRDESAEKVVSVDFSRRTYGVFDSGVNVAINGGLGLFGHDEFKMPQNRGTYDGAANGANIQRGRDEPQRKAVNARLALRAAGVGRAAGARHARGVPQRRVAGRGDGGKRAAVNLALGAGLLRRARELHILARRERQRASAVRRRGAAHRAGRRRGGRRRRARRGAGRAGAGGARVEARRRARARRQHAGRAVGELGAHGGRGRGRGARGGAAAAGARRALPAGALSACTAAASAVADGAPRVRRRLR